MDLRRFVLSLVVLLLPLMVYGQSQQKSVERDPDEELKKQGRKIEELEKVVEELKGRMEKDANEDKMRELLEEAQKLAREKKATAASVEERKFYSGLRQHSALNPNISVGGEYYFSYGTSDTEYNRVPSEVSWGTGQLFMREMELCLESVLDPYSRGKVILGFGRDEVGVEEGYIESLNWPLNMNLKLGKFKAQFGTINRFHNHALPNFERPLVMSNYFSFETLAGCGIAANFLLPSITAQVNELDLQIVSGGAGRSFTNEGKHNLVYIAHLKNYWDLNRSAYVELGLSGAIGHNDHVESFRTVIGGADLRIKWSPPGRAKYRGIEWWTEALISRRDLPGSHINTWGGFSLIQCRLGARWVCSCRLDYSRFPDDDSLEEFGGAVNIDFWQSEFVFVRLQYTHIERNFDEDDHRIVFQTCWAMGPHKHETY